MPAGEVVLQASMICLADSVTFSDFLKIRLRHVRTWWDDADIV